MALAKKSIKPVTIPGLLTVFEELKDHLLWYNVKNVAYHAEVAPSTIYFWLEEKTKTPRLDTFTKVAKAVGFNVQLINTQTSTAKKKLAVVK